MLLFILLNPSIIYALTEQTPYLNINNTYSFEVGSLSFTNVSFKDYSSTSTQAFGLSGMLINNSNNGNYKIKIGSASRTLTGEQTYIIKYTYNIGKDPIKDYDELYYNIIGNELDTVIGNTSFSIFI